MVFSRKNQRIILIFVDSVAFSSDDLRGTKVRGFSRGLGLSHMDPGRGMERVDNNQYFTYIKVGLFLDLLATVNYACDWIATVEHQSTRILIGKFELTVARAKPCVALKRKFKD